MGNEIMQIKMFGKLTLSYKGKTIDSDIIRSEMTELLLVYILCQHTNEITTQEICEKLWEENESDNPVGALKNLMYRLRTILKKTWSDEFIITGRGCYRWNPDIPVSMDVDKLEDVLQQATNEETTKNCRLLEEAIGLYQMPFLYKYTSQHWILQLSTYYQSQFTTAVKKLSSIYMYKKAFDKLELLCTQALQFDKYEESLHYFLLFSYMKQGKRKIAMEHYEATTKMIYDELGLPVSKELQNLHKSLINTENELEMDLSIIQRDLDEALLPNGAFFCEYGVFKEIYRLQARQAARLGMSIYCALISVKIALNIPKKSNTYKRIMNKSIEQLRDVLITTLRVGDCVSRYSVTQFVILLPTCTYETTVFVLERLVKNYQKQDKSGKIELTYDLRELNMSQE